MNNEEKVVAGLNHQSGDAQGTANTMTNTNENWEKEIDEKVLSFAYAVDTGTDIQVLAGKAVIKAFIRTLLAKRDEEIREMVKRLSIRAEAEDELEQREAYEHVQRHLSKEPQEAKESVGLGIWACDSCGGDVTWKKSKIHKVEKAPYHPCSC